MRDKWLMTIAVLAFAGTASAQTLTRGQLRGVVYDETKAALPGATVVLTNNDTGYSQTVVTGATGGYQFSQVPTGDYEILVTLSGFSTTQITGITINVGAALSYDISLGIASQTETITVEASGAPIDTGTGRREPADQRGSHREPASFRS